MTSSKPSRTKIQYNQTCLACQLTWIPVTCRGFLKDVFAINMLKMPSSVDINVKYDNYNESSHLDQKQKK